MKLSKRLKAHAVKNFGVKEGSKDTVFAKVISQKLLSGGLKVADYKKMTAGQKTDPEPPSKKTKKKTSPTGGPSAKELEKLVSDRVADQLKKAGIETDPRKKKGRLDFTPEMVFSKAEDIRVRVKEAADTYSKTSKAAVYPERSGRHGEGSKHLLAGQPACYGKTALNHPSDLDKAIAASYFKWCVGSTAQPNQIPRGLRVTDHDKELMAYAMKHCQWSGIIKGRSEDGEDSRKIHRRKLTEWQVKALLDDSISGGIEAAPIAFDDSIILIPVLYGELFPFVNVVNVARGRRMKGALMQNPGFTSGIAEGTAITPFNTAAFVSAFDTPIYPAVAAMEIGLDFEEDSPVDLGSSIIENYGLKSLEWLDRVIAVGDGTTEPLGIFNTTGTTAVSSDNGAGGPPTVSDYEGLMFAMPKQFRTEPGSVPVYIANDTSYRRATSISVGPGDERRVFGMDHASYSIMGTNYKVQNNIGNSSIGYVNLKRYRMYRRLGLNVRVETGGRSLALNNTRLIVLRMRFGGQLETGGAAAVMTDAQA